MSQRRNAKSSVPSSTSSTPTPSTTKTTTTTTTTSKPTQTTASQSPSDEVNKDLAGKKTTKNSATVPKTAKKRSLISRITNFLLRFIVFIVVVSSSIVFVEYLMLSQDEFSQRVDYFKNALAQGQFDLATSILSIKSKLLPSYYSV